MKLDFFCKFVSLISFTNLDAVYDAWGVGVANGGDLTYILSKVKATVSIQIHPSQRQQQQHCGQTNTPVGKYMQLHQKIKIWRIRTSNNSERYAPLLSAKYTYLN